MNKKENHVYPGTEVPVTFASQLMGYFILIKSFPNTADLCNKIIEVKTNVHNLLPCTLSQYLQKHPEIRGGLTKKSIEEIDKQILCLQENLLSISLENAKGNTGKIKTSIEKIYWLTVGGKLA
jgi:hypothetical protein